jgi:hypothetical protein
MGDQPSSAPSVGGGTGVESLIPQGPQTPEEAMQQLQTGPLKEMILGEIEEGKLSEEVQQAIKLILFGVMKQYPPMTTIQRERFVSAGGGYLNHLKDLKDKGQLQVPAAAMDIVDAAYQKWGLSISPVDLTGLHWDEVQEDYNRPVTAAPVAPKPKTDQEQQEVDEARELDLAKLSVKELKEMLRDRELTLEQRFRKAEALYIQARDGEVKLKPKTYAALEQAVSEMQGQFDVALTDKSLSAERQEVLKDLRWKNTELTIAMMKSREASILEYWDVVQGPTLKGVVDEAMDLFKDYQENPNDIRGLMEKAFAVFKKIAALWGLYEGSAAYTASDVPEEEEEGGDKPEEVAEEEEEGEEGEEKIPEKIDLTQIGAVTLNPAKSLLLVDGYGIAPDGTVLTSDGGPVFEVPDSIKPAMWFMKKNYAKLNAALYAVDPSRSQGTFLQLAMIGMRLEQKFQLESKPYSALSFMGSGGLSQMMAFAIQGKENSASDSLRNRYVLGWLGRNTSSGFRALGAKLGWNSSSDLMRYAVDLLTEDPALISRASIYAQGEVDSSAIIDQEVIEVTPWLKDLKEVTAVEGVVSLGGQYLLDTHGNITGGDASSEVAKGASAYVKDHQVQFARLGQKMHSEEPRKLLPQTIALCLKIQQRFAYQGKDADAVTYLEQHWDAIKDEYDGFKQGVFDGLYDWIGDINTENESAFEYVNDNFDNLWEYIKAHPPT